MTIEQLPLGPGISTLALLSGIISPYLIIPIEFP
ncbi:MAG: hypothetical protein ACI857_002889, partial [Arenicella sp.]